MLADALPIENQRVITAVADTLCNGVFTVEPLVIKHRNHVHTIWQELHTYAIVQITLDIVVCKTSKILRENIAYYAGAVSFQASGISIELERIFLRDFLHPSLCLVRNQRAIV